MLKCKCKNCGVSEVYKDETEAFMGKIDPKTGRHDDLVWYWVGERFSILICNRCYRKYQPSTETTVK